MQYSTNYNMNKPELNEQYRLSHWNENTDIIDTELKSQEDRIAQNENDISGLSSSKNDKITVTNDTTALTDSDSFDETSAGSNPTSIKRRLLTSLWTYIKSKITGAISSIVDSNLTISRALISDSNGKVAVSSTTSTELEYVHNVTSAIQTQIDGKVPTSRKVNGHALSADVTVTKGDVGLGNVANKGTDSRASNTSTNNIQNNVATCISNGAICSTASATQEKKITISGFTLFTGAVIRVLFTNNSSVANPTLNISYDGTNYVGAKSIKVVKNGTKVAPIVHSGKWGGASSATNRMWDSNTTLELIYDGTDWVIMGNPVLCSYFSTTYSYTVYANGLIKQFASGLTTSTDTWYTFAVAFTQKPAILCCTNNIASNSPPYWAFGWDKSATGFYYSNLGGGIDFIAIGY